MQIDDFTSKISEYLDVLEKMSCYCKMPKN